jgi:hypothetical protein
MMTTTGIAPWPAPTTPPIGSPKRRRRYWIDVLLGIGLAGAVVAFVCFTAMAMLTSNSCGTYGQPAAGFERYVAATLVSLAAVPTFFFALIGRAIFRSRARGR